MLRRLFLFLTFSIACLAQKESMLIGPGDLLHVHVFDTPELEQKVRVSDGGMVSLALIGDLRVAGLSATEAGHSIEHKLQDGQVMLQPQVSVSVEQYATQSVYVLGQVHNPGMFSVQTTQPILKILALAGGLTDLADRHITVQRHNSPEEVTYFLSNSSDEAINKSVQVYPGDTVVVPKAGVVYVMGDVEHPGGYSITTNNSQMTVLQALAMAGSANKTALSDRARLIRKTSSGEQEIRLHLAEMERGSSPDLPMKADDMIYVPFSFMKNMALSSSAIAAQATSAAIYAIH